MIATFSDIEYPTMHNNACWCNTKSLYGLCVCTGDNMYGLCVCTGDNMYGLCVCTGDNPLAKAR